MPFLPEDPKGNYPVTGIARDPNGNETKLPWETSHLIYLTEKPRIRLELREFKESDENLWNLYLLGLWQFQLVPQDKQLSYFQIAGRV